jgi:hypothetical protein
VTLPKCVYPCECVLHRAARTSKRSVSWALHRHQRVARIRSEPITDVICDTYLERLTSMATLRKGASDDEASNSDESEELTEDEVCHSWLLFAKNLHFTSEPHG